MDVRHPMMGKQTTAAKAGLHVQGQITEFNGSSINNAQDLM